MLLQDRIDLLIQLGQYMSSADESWESTKRKAHHENNWFIPDFINLSVGNIVQNYLQPEALKKLVQQYNIPEQQKAPKKVGLALAGNIPLVGFHDVLCVFLSGHYAIIKPSSKDETLMKHLVEKMISWNAGAAPYMQLQPMLKGCDAYIATGSNNTSRYFEYYFRNYPSIIRSNRTSVGVLTGKESIEDLEKLSDDIHQYFGLGCRNVTQLYVPRHYDFIPLLAAFDKYSHFSNHHKYKNNYDYNLSMHILNNRYYMTNGSTLLVEDASPFSAISQVHFQYYDDVKDVQEILQSNKQLQCRVGFGGLPFGGAQCPGLLDFADGVDTLSFLMNLPSNS
jgi:hypothetical protein